MSERAMSYLLELGGATPVDYGAMLYRDADPRVHPLERITPAEIRGANPSNIRVRCLLKRYAFVAIAIMLLVAANLAARGANAYQAWMDKGYAALEAARAQTALLDAAASAHDEANARTLFQAILAQYRRALEDFENAAQADASNPNPWFFRGVTFNRIGELIQRYNEGMPARERGAPQAFCAAVREINRSIGLGMTTEQNPAFLVELAAALLASGDNVEARDAADRFLASSEADPTLRERAIALKQKAEANILANKKIEPIHICAKAPKPVVIPGKPAATSPDVQSQFLKSITTGVGYNGNVTQLARGSALPPTTPHKGAFFNESALNLESDWFFHHQDGADDLVDKLAATYLLVHDAYDDLSSANSLIQKVGINYCRAISTNACAGVQLNDTWIRDDSITLSNLLALQPSFSYATSPDLTTQVSYAITRSDFSKTPKEPLAVLDGFSHQVAIQETWSHALGEGQWWPQIAITGKYAYQWTESDGIVGDKERDNALLKTEWAIFRAGDLCSFIRSVALSASYEYREDTYDNATFPSLTASRRFKRHDTTHLIDVALVFKLWYDENLKNRLEAVLQYQSTTNDSNVATKAYDQPRVIASVKVNF